MLNGRWQLGLPECLGLQPRVMCEKCRRLPFPAPRSAQRLPSAGTPGYRWKTHFQHACCFTLPGKIQWTPPCAVRRMWAFPELQNELFSFKKHREI